MSALSLIVHGVSEYLHTHKTQPSGHKVYPMVFWLLIISGALFGLSGLYDYYSIVYTPVIAKIYMSFILLGLAISGWMGCMITKGVRSLFGKPKEDLRKIMPIEQYAKDIWHSVETDGSNLIKQHPFPAVLVGLSIGLLSGMIGRAK